MITPSEPAAIPSPAMHEVMHTNSVRQVSSGYTSSDGVSTGYFQSRDMPIETNEHLPLITPTGCLPTHSIVTTFSQPSLSTQSSHLHTFGVNQPAHLNDNGSVASNALSATQASPRDVPIMQRLKRYAFVRLRSCDKSRNQRWHVREAHLRQQFSEAKI